ncbi:MAG: FAD-dependent oxidoreductase [Thermoguttaceae bacterium]
MQEKGDSINRRDWMRFLGVSGAAVSLDMLAVRNINAKNLGESRGFTSHTVAAHESHSTRTCASVDNGKVVQPSRELPVLHKTDVLVVGGGPAGVTAAIAAKRAGADVTLVERYGHFGGLWTGGLVLLIIGHITKDGKQTCQGIGEEMMRRLDKWNGAIMNRRPGEYPTVDAEAAKYLMIEMIEEAGVHVFLHCWGVDAIMNSGAVAGAVFESKSGRQAILAKVVIDATGDGDMFSAAGAEYERRLHNIGLVSRIGKLDEVDRAKAAQSPTPKHLGAKTPVPGVNWVNLAGPEADGLDVATLTRLEMNHRKFMWKSLQKTRNTPGYEKTYLVETAPQLGVRITRVLNGVDRITRGAVGAASPIPDAIGVGGASNREHGPWQIPYGALVPKKLDNLLAAGRCVSAEVRMADLVRLIPNCFVTGQAAGVAAAVAVQDGCRPRDVDIAKVQKILKQQEAYLG